VAGRDRPHLRIVTNMSAPTSASTERRFGEPLLLSAQTQRPQSLRTRCCLPCRGPRNAEAPLPPMERRGHDFDVAGPSDVAGIGQRESRQRRWLRVHVQPRMQVSTGDWRRTRSSPRADRPNGQSARSSAAGVSKIVAIELAPQGAKGKVFAAPTRPPLRSTTRSHAVCVRRVPARLATEGGATMTMRRQPAIHRAR
jgi:hypothetical protein